MMNMEWQALDFEVPDVPGRVWHTAIDTGAPSPADAADHGREPRFEGRTCRVGDRSIIVLVSRPA
jgi:hypothetical protein